MRKKSSMQVYAEYHTKTITKVTHCIGIPLILLSIQMLSALLWVVLFGYSVRMSWIVLAVLSLVYICVTFSWGLLTAVFLALITLLANKISFSFEFHTILFSAITLFILGWVFQFAGHYFEKNQPLFFENVTQALIAPVFVVRELFMVLWR